MAYDDTTRTKRQWEGLGFAPTLTPIPRTKTPVKPSRGLLRGFNYTPSAKTDVQATWRRFGWKPTHEQD